MWNPRKKRALNSSLRANMPGTLPSFNAFIHFRKRRVNNRSILKTNVDYLVTYERYTDGVFQHSLQQRPCNADRKYAEYE